MTMEPKNSLTGTILEMREEHIAAIARIHAKELAGDFLPSMGTDFLKTMYSGVLKSEQSIAFVYVIEKEVVGFVLAAKDTKKLFRDAFWRKGLELAITALKKVIQRPLIVPKIVQTILYPNGGSETAELLVIAVDDAHKHRHIGSELVAALNAVFMLESVPEYRVWTYKNNEEANRFYRAAGLRLDRSFRVYGKECNMYKYCLPKRR